MSYDFHSLMGLSETGHSKKNTHRECPTSVMRQSFAEGGTPKFGSVRGRPSNDFDDPRDESALNQVGDSLSAVGNIGIQGLGAYKMMKGEDKAVGKNLDKKSSREAQRKEAIRNASVNNPDGESVIKKPLSSYDLKNSYNKSANVQNASVNSPYSTKKDIKQNVFMPTNNVARSPIKSSVEMQGFSRQSAQPENAIPQKPELNIQKPGLNINSTDEDPYGNQSFFDGFARGGAVNFNPKIERFVTARELFVQDPKRDRAVEEQEEQLQRQRQQLNAQRYQNGQ